MYLRCRTVMKLECGHSGKGQTNAYVVFFFTNCKYVYLFCSTVFLVLRHYFQMKLLVKTRTTVQQ